MKLFYSPTSPYVRKVSAVAIELGLADKIERVTKVVSPVARDELVAASNPLGKVPTFVTDDGQALYDSRVICEYLDTLGGNKLFPASGAARWTALTRQALGDGLLDAALLVRYEGFLRPEDKRWSDWSQGQMTKVAASMAEIERQAPGFAKGVDIGLISIGCALGYLDFRYADMKWRDTYKATAAWAAAFNERPSMKTTVPAA